jgi:hypothetical protein
VGDVFLSKLPRCPVHAGLMRWDGRATYTCAGYDGEGCPHTVTVDELPWVHLGQTTGEIGYRVVEVHDG